MENYNVFNVYSPSVAQLLWIYFLFATLLTQIIFMNTLIAILSDTYSKIVSNKSYYTQRHQIRLYADYIHFIQIKPIIKNRYFYLVKPTEDAEEQSEISDLFRKLQSKVSEEIEKSTTLISAQLKAQNVEHKKALEELSLKMDQKPAGAVLDLG